MIYFIFQHFLFLNACIVFREKIAGEDLEVRHSNTEKSVVLFLLKQRSIVFTIHFICNFVVLLDLRLNSIWKVEECLILQTFSARNKRE